MKEKQPQKSTKGRKLSDPDLKKEVIRASVPTAQARAARRCAKLQGIELGEFVENALKEAIYKDALLQHGDHDS